ncbi:MAG: type II toxin-antitoxin system RelE/ParE family toxin [Nitrospinaceae bacterium]
MADYFITRRAAFDLPDIYVRSVENWGEGVADEYIKAIYGVFKQIAESPDLGRAREGRSRPFLMYPVKQHLVIYEAFPKGIMVAALLDQVGDIESIIKGLGPSFGAEITALKKQLLDRKD